MIPEAPILFSNATRSFGVYALPLTGLLARPMLAFLFVLASFERD